MALWEDNYRVYGARKLWKAARRAGHDVGRDQVARLMRASRHRGRPPRQAGPHHQARSAARRAHPDLVNRDFTATGPNRLWVTDLTYVPTWAGVAYVCFIIDALLPDDRRVAGRVAHADHDGARRDRDGPLVTRHPLDGLRCHSDAGSQFTSIRYGERLAEIGAVPSIGTVGDSYDNALAETVNGYYKAELIRGPARPGPWKTVEDVELATLGWVHWHNTDRLHGYLGDVPPAEFEAAFYATQRTGQPWSKSNSPSLHQTQCDSVTVVATCFRCSMWRLVRVELFARIRRDARVEGLSIRELARRHGVGRPTVRQALAQAEPPARKPRVRTAPRLDAFKAAIDEMLRQDLDAPRKQRHTARRVFARLAEEHDATDLSYSTVRDYVRRRRPEIDLEAGRLPEVFVPQEHAPGAEAEVDFGEVWVVLAGVKTKCHMFAFRLSHSGKAIHRIYPTQAQEAFLEGHIDAFEDIGGIPTRHIRYDNLTDAVVKVIYGSGRQRTENQRWVLFRSHYGFDAF